MNTESEKMYSIASSVKMLSEQVSKGRVESQVIRISKKPWLAPESVTSPSLDGLDRFFVAVRPDHQKVYQMETDTMKLVTCCAYSNANEMVIETKYEKIADADIVKKVNEKEPKNEYRFFFQPLFMRTQVPAEESSVDVETAFFSFTEDEIRSIHTNIHKIIDTKDRRIDNYAIVLVVSVALDDLTATECMPKPYENGHPNIMQISRQKFSTEFCNDILAPRRRGFVRDDDDDDDDDEPSSKRSKPGASSA